MIITTSAFQTVYTKLFVCLFSVLSSLNTVAVANVDEWLQGEAAYQQGQFAQAAALWQRALPHNPAQATELNLKIAAAYQARGAHLEAIAQLEQSLASNPPPTGKNSLLLRKNLADLYRLTQQLESAETHLKAALAVLDADDTPDLAAAVLHSQAQLLATQGFYQKALTAYATALTHAQTAKNPLLSAKILINQVHVQQALEASDLAAQQLIAAFAQVQQLPDNYETAFLMLAIVELSQTLAPTLTPKALGAANQLASQLNHPVLQAYAKGYLGHAYLHQQVYPQALAATRQAIFYAQLHNRVNDPLLYRWHWQLAKIFNATQQWGQASKAYAQAIQYLQPIRQTLLSQPHYFNASFEEAIAQVYLEFVDLLLKQAEQVQGAAQQAILSTVLQTLEQLKVAELEDYFQEPCVTPWQTNAEVLAQHPSSAAVYSIVLPERLVLLLHHAGTLSQYTIAVTPAELTTVLSQLQFEMQAVGSSSFLPHSQQLYTWLLAPLDDYLTTHAVKTLVILPDAQLRHLPLALLHDGEQFAIEKWAFAITPGLELTAPPDAALMSPKVMLNGLSEGVQGFTPLPAVSSELQRIQQLYGESSVFLNEGFILERLETALQQNPYQVIHIASHGEFSSDPQQTFILTYDDKLHMNRLETLLKYNQQRHEPIDLLTLSACKTAYGNQRAALGLAGVAVKAGARSALATLWYVDDKATAELIVAFYRFLRQSGTGKAVALQRAQQAMLETPNYQHPLYWGGFLLVGNWL